jgi:hypothetical protein
MDNRIRFVFLALAFLSVFACKSPISRQTVPGIPQDLVIDTDANGNATLSWAAVSDADSYTVYYSADNSTYAAHASTSGTSRLVPFYGWYKVSAENEAGEGTASAGIERVVPTAPNGQAATPAFSVAEGTYDAAQSVAITCSTGGATIYYTTDGSTPIVGTSTTYTSAIDVAAGDTTTITAIAVATDYANSDAARGTFHVRTWETVGGAGFSGGEVYDVSLALDGTGTPYVGYRDLSASNKATVMKFGGSSWAALGGIGVSAAGAYYTSLAVDSADVAYIAYSDASVSGKATVRKYTGASWTTLGTAGFSDGEALYLSLAVHDAGSLHTPYLGYQDGGTSTRATVQAFTGTAWTAIGAKGFSSGTISAASLAIASDGTPYLAFIDQDYKVTVMRYDGSAWTVVGTAGFSTVEVGFLSLALDSLDTPYVAYSGGSTYPAVKATVAKWDGTDWTVVGTANFSAGAASYLDLDLAADDTPYVAYKDAAASPVGSLTVMRYDGSVWKAVGGQGISAGSADYVGLALAPSGTPFVAFKDGGTSPAGKATVLAWR